MTSSGQLQIIDKYDQMMLATTAQLVNREPAFGVPSHLVSAKIHCWMSETCT